MNEIINYASLSHCLLLHLNNQFIQWLKSSTQPCKQLKSNIPKVAVSAMGPRWWLAINCVGKVSHSFKN